MLVKIPLETERTKHHSQFITGPSATGRKSRRIRYNSQNTELFLPASKEIGRLPSRCTSIHSRPRHLAHTATSSCQSCNGPVLLYTLTYHLTVKNPTMAEVRLRVSPAATLHFRILEDSQIRECTRSPPGMAGENEQRESPSTNRLLHSFSTLNQ